MGQESVLHSFWQQLWARIEEIGPGVVLNKVKAHVREKKRVAAQFSLTEWQGHAWADTFAKNMAPSRLNLQPPSELGCCMVRL